jgi:hypothetical protein
MDDRTLGAAEHIVQTASQLQELAAQSGLPVVAHLLRLVILEAGKSAAPPLMFEPPKRPRSS